MLKTQLFHAHAPASSSQWCCLALLANRDSCWYQCSLSRLDTRHSCALSHCQGLQTWRCHCIQVEGQPCLWQRYRLLLPSISLSTVLLDAFLKREISTATCAFDNSAETLKELLLKLDIGTASVLFCLSCYYPTHYYRCLILLAACLQVFLGWLMLTTRLPPRMSLILEGTLDFFDWHHHKVSIDH